MVWRGARGPHKDRTPRTPSQHGHPLYGGCRSPPHTRTHTHDTQHACYRHTHTRTHSHSTERMGRAPNHHNHPANTADRPAYVCQSSAANRGSFAQHTRPSRLNSA